MTNDKLLLHTCCAPCLIPAFDVLRNNTIELIWYNPNIAPWEEYLERFQEVKRYAKLIGAKLTVLGPDYNLEHKQWLDYIKGLEQETEGGKRCAKCFEYRLKRVSEIFRNKQFATTLVVSPFKNSELIDNIGKEISERYFSYKLDKQEGNKKSIAKCKKNKIYRQKHCGCEFSIKN